MSKINVIDIGAVGGLEAPWSHHQDKIGQSLSFEPNEPPILSGDHLRYNSAVWNVDGEAKFYVSGPNGTGSSLLKQNYNWVRENFDKIKNEGRSELNNSWFDRSKITHEFDCSTKKLDTILAEIDIGVDNKRKFHFLKSDTQGGEFFILEGAQKYLQEDCVGLDLELFRYPLYEGVITEEKVINHLQNMGFHIAGWTGYQNSFNATSDYLFLRSVPRNEDERDMIATIEKIYKPKGKEKIIKHNSIMRRVISKINSLYT